MRSNSFRRPLELNVYEIKCNIICIGCQNTSKKIFVLYQFPFIIIIIIIIIIVINFVNFNFFFNVKNKQSR